MCIYRSRESGTKDVSLTVPDTITTWETEAFCLSPQGFGLAPRKQFTVFQPFFLELSLPYSIIRGEHFELKATTFNYLSSCIMVINTFTSLIVRSAWKTLGTGVKRCILLINWWIYMKCKLSCPEKKTNNALFSWLSLFTAIRLSNYYFSVTLQIQKWDFVSWTGHCNSGPILRLHCHPSLWQPVHILSVCQSTQNTQLGHDPLCLR